MDGYYLDKRRGACKPCEELEGCIDGDCTGDEGCKACMDGYFKDG